MEGLERTGKHLGADFIRSQVLFICEAVAAAGKLLPSSPVFTRFNDKSGTVGLSIPKSDHLVCISNDLQISP